jgi:glutaconate CoA-transferase subunit A
MSMHDAISKFVHDGDHIAFGGFTTNRKPYAAVAEILRQGQKDFIVEAGPAGGDWDMLIGEHRVKAWINCYTANSGFTAVSRRFRKAIEKGEMLFEDYSQDAAVLMFTGAAMGLPYIPFRAMLGSGLVDEIGISEEQRKKLPKLPSKKFVIDKDPFTGETVCLLPCPKLDVAIIHAQKASPDGTVRIEGDEFHDVDIAISSKYTIVTCEEIVTEDWIRQDPDRNKIPSICVDAVVHAPFGAYPAQCYNYYDLDRDRMREYDRVSNPKNDGTPDSFENYVKNWYLDVKDHNEFLDKVGASRLINLRVIPGLGYYPEKEVF